MAFQAYYFLTKVKALCPPTFSGNILNVDLVFMGHVTKDGKDGEPRDEAGDTVYGTGQHGIPAGKNCCWFKLT